jgi:hypothetical protein
MKTVPASASPRLETYPSATQPLESQRLESSMNVAKASGKDAAPKDTSFKIEQVHCPNCGSYAERHHLQSLEGHVTRTQCRSCDYLMVMSAKSGKVIEAYAPGIGELPNFCSLSTVI